MKVTYKINLLLAVLLFFGFQVKGKPSEGRFSVSPELVFHDLDETLNKIIEIVENKEKGAYLRFGDGDINLARGEYDSYQRPCRKLSVEMREALSLSGQNIVKTLPLHCPELSEDTKFMPEATKTDISWVNQFLKKVAPFWGKKITDVYSPWILPFMAVAHEQRCVEFLKFLKGKNCCLFVGNKNIPEIIKNVLFGEGCVFVPTPDRNSYLEIDRIERECLENIPKNDEYKIIIVSMGCSGRVLEKRLFKKMENIFLFDFGSLMDAFCGWKTRAWMEYSGFDGKKFMENYFL
ncbi:GT-D fold domain-containing glycosyltransferase [Candidatus Dependentiae bacterium]